MSVSFSISSKKLLLIFLLVFASSPFFVFASATDGIIDSTYKYAWGENIGWLNFGTPGGNVHITDSALTGYVWSPNYGWINLSPTLGGVANNGEGVLSGNAWGENLGWINFSGVNISSQGQFSGLATISRDNSLISFSCANCIVKTDWRPVSTRGGPGPGPSPGPGGPGPVIITGVNFIGRAYPGSQVVLLKDAQLIATDVAGTDASFKISITGISAGNYIFSIYSQDNQGNRSDLLNFPITVTPGVIIDVSGIFIGPTIAVDKSEVKKGDNIAIFGQSAPQAQINININSDQQFFVKTNSDKNGIYLYNFDTAELNMGQHATKSKATLNGDVSAFSKLVGFLVGTKNVMAAPTAKCPAKADLNNDCRVNLVDFSIAAYWYKRTITPAFLEIEKEQLNGDGRITLVDFSIMAYYWTG